VVVSDTFFTEGRALLLNPQQKLKQENDINDTLLNMKMTKIALDDVILKLDELELVFYGWVNIRGIAI
jgi:hypothetical protein